MTRRVEPPAPPSPEQLRRWGLDPAWSRQVDVAAGEGTTHRWHVLDTTAVGTGPTVVCVHGNPTWSWMWGSFLHRFAAAGYRVVAPDLLGMGYSDRTIAPRRYTERVADLDHVLDALDVDGPVVLVAHDWGGAISMGWAVEHPDRVAAMILANTGIAVPAGRRAPGIIRLAAAPGVHDLATRRTRLFVCGTSWLSRDRLTAIDREALVAPYRRAVDRPAIADFVADIPFTADHPSAAAIDLVASSLDVIAAPTLLLWGGRDPVFDDDVAADLLARFGRGGGLADLHRFPGAGHLVVAETATGPGPGAADVAAAWLVESTTHRHGAGAGLGPTADGGRRDPSANGADRVAGGEWGDRRPLGAAITERAGDPVERDVVAFHDGASGRSITFGELDRLVARIGAGLQSRGIRRGDRVAVLVPPSIELIGLVYACWRIGAVTVIADRGLGLGGLGRAIRGARVDALVGSRRALVAARALRWSPSASPIDLAALTEQMVTGRPQVGPAVVGEPGPDDPAAVLFTSGATGPAKGVRYTHGRLAHQRDALTELYGIGPDDRFVAAFAPFALYGPALGITAAVPDVDVTTPGALTADALDAACAAIDATMVFASPAALANVVRTRARSGPALAAVRMVMSAGAPVPIRTLRAVAELVPVAELHTPYGMTEVLPVADIDLAELEGTGVGAGVGVGGVCVGRPVTGCTVGISSLDGARDPGQVGDIDHEIGRTGEVWVSAPWTSTGYDGSWATERAARTVDADGREWHRSGDVGHLDADGRLWIEGRAVHVVWTAGGPVTSVPAEVVVETLDDVDRAAVVGVGPDGIQQVVVVVEPGPDGSRPSHRRSRRVSGRRRADRPLADRPLADRPLADLDLADLDLTDRVRAVLAPLPVAAVCTTGALPVDIRHNAKIDRARVAGRVATLLAGGGTPASAASCGDLSA